MPEEPVQSFSDRTAGRPPRERRHEFPTQLREPLHRWLLRFLDERLEQRVALRMELESPWPAATRPIVGELGQLLSNEQLLDAVDYALQLDRDLARELHLDRTIDVGEPEYSQRWGLVDELSDLFDDALSTLQVTAGEHTFLLAHRVDPTAQTSFDQVLDTADDTAGPRLRAAWSAAYGRDSEPDTAYRDAIRAVEVAISSVVSPNNDRQTLGTAVRDLRNGAHNYELVLLDKTGNGSVKPLVDLLERLWEGQKSRHGAGYGARPSTLEEARAAVQGAVLAVQWLADGALRRRGTAGTP